MTEQCDLVVSRIFNAPRELVWQTWVKPEHIQRWWGPNHFTCPSAVIDFREGGTSLVCMRASPQCGGRDFFSLWFYRRIIPLELIDFVQHLADENGQPIDPVELGMPPDFPREMRTVVKLKPLGNQTEMTVTEYGWSAGHMHDLSVAGLNQCVDKLERIFVNA